MSLDKKHEMAEALNVIGLKMHAMKAMLRKNLNRDTYDKVDRDVAVIGKQIERLLDCM